MQGLRLDETGSAIGRLVNIAGVGEVSRGIGKLLVGARLEQVDECGDDAICDCENSQPFYS